MDLAGRLADALRSRKADVFFDAASIEGGDRWPDRIREGVERCDVFLEVIGTVWLGAKDSAFRRRIDSEQDWVRLEIETALRLGKRIVPVLVGGAAMPGREELPDSIAELANRQGVRLDSGGSFDRDFEALAQLLGFPAAVAPDFGVLTSNRLDEILANLFVFCRDRFPTMHNAVRVGGAYRKTFQKKGGVLRRMVSVRNSLTLDGLDSIRDELAAENADDGLARMAALLWAVSEEFGENIESAARFCRFQVRAHSSFGGEVFWVSTTPLESVWEAFSQPRTPDEISDGVSILHPRLLITPAAVKAISIRIERMEARLWQRMEARKATLQVAVSPLTAHGVRLRIVCAAEGADPCAFVVDGAVDEVADCEALLAILRKAHGEGVALLVLPELRMTPGMVEVLRDFLEGQAVSAESGLLMVAAGSWHVPDGTDYVNRCVVLGHRGGVLWDQDKLEEFHLVAENVAKDPAYWANQGIGPAGAVESIRKGTVQVAVDGPVGRLAAAICSGFFQERAAALLAEVKANFYLVPAMSAGCGELEVAAMAMVRRRAGTFVANCGATGGVNGRSFYVAARKGAKVERIGDGEGLLAWRFSDSLVP